MADALVACAQRALAREENDALHVALNALLFATRVPRAHRNDTTIKRVDAAQE